MPSGGGRVVDQSTRDCKFKRSNPAQPPVLGAILQNFFGRNLQFCVSLLT